VFPVLLALLVAHGLRLLDFENRVLPVFMLLASNVDYRSRKGVQLPFEPGALCTLGFDPFPYFIGKTKTVAQLVAQSAPTEATLPRFRCKGSDVSD
jgi:hypothetical protein